MSATGLDVFDTTLQKTNHLLNDTMQILGWQDRRRAYLALRAGLHALRDRLTVEETAQLAAQLPMLVRGFYYEGWDPSRKPRKDRQREEFLERVAQPFVGVVQDVDPERVARAVFAVLALHVTGGEIEDVKRQLPAEIREMFPEEAGAPTG
jgi:uncharacterized protein (DUF2267 family)